jgi:molecular chaperone HscC
VIVGIDLGTSNSLIAVFRDGTPVLVPNALGNVLTPSAVSIDADGTVLVGEAARDRAITHPELTALAFKRAMGTNKPFMLGRRSFRAEELSALVLGALKSDAEATFGVAVTEAVVTVPAYFNDGQRQATRTAAQLAGLTVRRLLNEPTAAALAYGLLENTDAQAKLLVLDLGGGTFDVSIIEKFEGIVEVRATAGDNFLGGEDFVDAIVARFMREAVSLATPDASMRAQIRRKAEAFKRDASDRQSATMSAVIDGRMVELTMTAEELTELYAPLLGRIRTPIQRAMHDSRLTPDDITGVVLAGGATRMPDIRRMAARLFGRMPIAHLNPDEVVARGAATYAALLARDEAFKEVVVTDVAPYSMGIEVSKDVGGRLITGTFSPIIERNTVIPVSRVEPFTTVKLGQTSVKVEVYQGESRLVRDNVALGTIDITVPRNPTEHESFDVRFTYDRDGILEVEVTVRSTQQAYRAVFQNNGTLSGFEIEERLQRLNMLKMHPREAAENVAALARSDRVFQEHLGAARDAIAQKSAEFSAAIEGQDARVIARARAELLALLDRIEGSTWSFDDL